jgi:hypothetical protein
MPKGTVMASCQAFSCVSQETCVVPYRRKVRAIVAFFSSIEEALSDQAIRKPASHVTLLMICNPFSFHFRVERLACPRNFARFCHYSSWVVTGSPMRRRR